jgi:hypothetical protein
VAIVAAVEHLDFGSRLRKLAFELSDGDWSFCFTADIYKNETVLVVNLEYAGWNNLIALNRTSVRVNEISKCGGFGIAKNVGNLAIELVVLKVETPDEVFRDHGI